MKALTALLLALLASAALADVTGPTTGTFPTQIVSPTTGQCLMYTGLLWANSACAGGGGGSLPIGCTSGQYPANTGVPNTWGCFGPPLTQANSTTVTADTTTTPGSVYFNALGYHGVDFASLGNGLVKNTTSTGVPTIATACTDFAGLACTNTFTIVQNNILSGQTGNTFALAHVFENNTAAASGQQQFVCEQLTGFGWNTTTPASNEADWIICNTPTQGTAVAPGLVFRSQVAGGGYTTQMTLGDAGAAGDLIIPNTMKAGAFTASASSVPAGASIYSGATNVLSFASNGVFSGSIDVNHHWKFGSTSAPTISSGACGTGTNGTISGNDQGGTITIASATTSTCAITFALAYSATPHLVILQAANSAAATAVSGEFISALSTTGFTITGTLASTTWYYVVQ